jgi:hypothetical protein
MVIERRLGEDKALLVPVFSRVQHVQETEDVADEQVRVNVMEVWETPEEAQNRLLVCVLMVE